MFTVGNGCINFAGWKDRKGYGKIRTGKNKTLAHRYSLEYFSGVKVPTGMVVMHSCDNPSCINPNHLSIGTQSENIRDAFTRKRKVSPQSLKTECPKGHSYSDPANVYRIGSTGHKKCRICKNVANQEYKKKIKCRK